MTSNTPAATAANAKSALGINLSAMSYYSSEQPFLNIFKTSGVNRSTPAGWYTHSSMNFNTGEAPYLQLDANGYPTTLKASSADPHSPQLFTSVGVLLERNLPRSNNGTGLPYRAGQYVVLYDGQGTLDYQADAKLVSSSPGRDIINVQTPSNQGIDLRITTTDPNHNGNYIRNIRVVKAEEESLLIGGSIFEPQFLSLLSNFHVVRAMQWLGIDDAGGRLTNWADRPLPSDAGWGSPIGVPIESVLQLCNTVGADCWVNVPHQANDDYITRMAVLAHTILGSGQKLYIEFSNEVWNGIFAQSNYASARGQALWPNAGASPFAYNRSWYGMRTAQMCDIWKSVWGGDATRLVCVLGAQSSNSGTALQALECPLWVGNGNSPCSNHNINAVAVAPYFGNFAPKKSFLAAGDGGHAQLFQEISNDLAQVARGEAQDKLALARYNLPLIAYEGGQTLVTNDPPLLGLYIAANRDARMGNAYTRALTDWKASGG
ncbi:MAG: cellulose-binding protein, partial [Candidatus Eremiobacteraeota bacterium]|nr:cellulose-binding protein [Candidatus Eremiobacteraeota bacterium]